MNSVEIIENLFAVVSLLEKTGNRIFTPEGLTTNMAAVLLCIRSGHNKNSDLCAFLEGSPSAIAQKLSTLEKKEFIQRTLDVSDKRSWTFSLTQKGENVLDSCMPRYTKAADSLFGGFSVQENEFLSSFLKNTKQKLLFAHNNPLFFKTLF